jgi:hypothetical protein
MRQPKDYDWETQRINAFLIMDNKLYEGREHIDCFGKALNMDLSGYAEINEVEEDLDIEITQDYILGEVSDIDEIRSIICIGDMKTYRDTISKYYKDISYENYYD